MMMQVVYIEATLHAGDTFWLMFCERIRTEHGRPPSRRPLFPWLRQVSNGLWATPNRPVNAVLARNRSAPLMALYRLPREKPMQPMISSAMHSPRRTFTFFQTLTILFLQACVTSLYHPCKLLENLQPHKATGPDALLLLLLRSGTTTCETTNSMIQEPPESLEKYPCASNAQKGSKHPRNHRPASLTPMICKLQKHSVVSNIITQHKVHGILP